MTGACGIVKRFTYVEHIQLSSKIFNDGCSGGVAELSTWELSVA